MLKLRELEATEGVRPEVKRPCRRNPRELTVGISANASSITTRSVEREGDAPQDQPAVVA